MTERRARWAGLVAVALWIASVIVTGSGAPAENATDAEYLAHVEKNADVIIFGGFAFMLGCAAFLWFAVVLRARLAAAEGGSRMLADIAFVGAVLVGAFMMVSPGPEMGLAIHAEEREVDAVTAATMRLLPEGFLMAAEASAILLMVGSSLIAWRTRVFPKAWAVFGFVLALALAVPLIGWFVLLIAMPIWVLATTVLLIRRDPPAAQHNTA